MNLLNLTTTTKIDRRTFRVDLGGVSTIVSIDPRGTPTCSCGSKRPDCIHVQAVRAKIDAEASLQTDNLSGFQRESDGDILFWKP